MNPFGQQRVVWITGAGSGIGSSLARRFASGGDVVILSGRSEEKLQTVQAALHSAGQRCEVLPCDVCSEDSIHRCAEAIHAMHQKVDVLINNAGVTYFKEFINTTIQEFDHVLHTNLRGLFLTSKEVLPAMVKHQTGKIINILSFAAKKTYTKSSVYAASKAGAKALMDGLREEIRDRGIQIVNIYPGAVLTPIWNDAQQERFRTQMMQPEEVAEVIFHLSQQPDSLMVEELILRPQIGDFHV